MVPNTMGKKKEIRRVIARSAAHNDEIFDLVMQYKGMDKYMRSTFSKAMEIENYGLILKHEKSVLFDRKNYRRLIKRGRYEILKYEMTYMFNDEKELAIMYGQYELLARYTNAKLCNIDPHLPYNNEHELCEYYKNLPHISHPWTPIKWAALNNAPALLLLLFNLISDFKKVLLCATGRGHVNILKLVWSEQPGYFLHYKKYILRKAVKRGHLNIISYMVFIGIKFHAYEIATAKEIAIRRANFHLLDALARFKIK